MDMFSVPVDAIARTAARLAGVPRWQVGAIIVPSGLYAHVRILKGDTVTVHERDVRLDDVSESARDGRQGGAP